MVPELQLKEGDSIEVHGWVMLKELSAGKYRVKSVEVRGSDAIYSLVKYRGSVVRRYWYRQIENCIHNNGLNFIEKI